ncbi:hypothetical protein GOBAR_DD31665 [Gossypium barbadense]|nr:hypothetical protein GOBAR_DD31665 [Gossypium barbadense]
MARFFLQWLSLVAIIWLQSKNGTNSNFPAYSSQLKHFIFISQIQLNNLAFAPPMPCLFLIGRVSNLSYGAIFFLAMLAGNSICWINTTWREPEPIFSLAVLLLTVSVMAAPVVRVINAYGISIKLVITIYWCSRNGQYGG